MEATTIREHLHEYVEKGDEKLLRLMYALAKEYDEDDLYEYDFTEEEIEDFDERSKKRSSGESKTYGWQQAKEIITGKRNINEV
ncbi:MAG: hypothetical protein M3015_03620 [Bacteroidota bacterium]|nr:hypothetical protein [Bacteroidota bacterium]